MNNKLIVSVLVAAVVCGGGGYYLGSSGSKSTSGRAAGFAGGTFAGRTGTRGGGAGAVFGTVIAKDTSSITVQLGGPNASSTNGTATGSKIILFNSSTQVEKTVSGSSADLSVGTGVSVTGTTNSDGSLTAQNIQIRPWGAGPRGGASVGQ